MVIIATEPNRLDVFFEVEGGEAAMEEVENMPDTIKGGSYSWNLRD